VEFGEKNDVYFLGLEKKRQITKSITKLLDDEGNIITNQRDIFFAFILLNVIVISLISTLSASHNSLQFFKSLLILAEYFNIMSFILSELVKQEDTMHLLSPVFAFIAIQLIARSLDFTLHNNTLIHTKVVQAFVYEAVHTHTLLVIPNIAGITTYGWRRPRNCFAAYNTWIFRCSGFGSGAYD
jgi:hypothetical protein